MVSMVCSAIWQISERSGIPLERFAPYVFGGMIGSWPRKVKQ